MRGFISIWLLYILAIVEKGVECLKCYHCDTSNNPACGIYFKAYQFKAQECKGLHFKCALQRQLPDADNWVGIIRGCFALGSVENVSDADGCEKFKLGAGYATLCKCSTDYCNAAVTLVQSYYTLFLIVPMSFALVIICAL